MFCIPIIAAAAAGTILCGQCNSNSFSVGGVNLKEQCWIDNPVCINKKQASHAQCLADKKRSQWRTNPAYVAANFLNYDFICDKYKCAPATVCEIKICSGRSYVTLSFNDCSKMIFELYQPAKQGINGIWYVKRYAYV